MKWQKWGRRLAYTLIIVGFVVLVWPVGAKPAVPKHQYDPKFALEFSVNWNLKHPKAPILDMACLRFPAESAKAAGVPGAGSNIPSVPAYEDCMVKEAAPKKGKTVLVCGEVTIRPHYTLTNPDAALIAGSVLPCAEVGRAIKSIRTSYNGGVA